MLQSDHTISVQYNIKTYVNYPIRQALALNFFDRSKSLSNQIVMYVVS